MFGVSPHQSWWGVVVDLLLLNQFRVQTAHAIASPHSSRWICLAYRRLRPVSKTVRLARSATPFCSGVCGADDSKRILWSDSHDLNAELMDSPPLSDRRVWMRLPVSLRRKLAYSLKYSGTSDLCFRKQTWRHPENLSVKSTKQRAPLGVGNAWAHKRLRE